MLQYFCKNCGFKLFPTNEEEESHAVKYVVSPREIISRYNGVCPKCGSKLCDKPSKIVYEVNARGKNIYKVSSGKLF